MTVVLDVEFPGIRSSREELNQAETHNFTSRISQFLDYKFTEARNSEEVKHNSDHMSKWIFDVDFPQRSPINQSLGDKEPHISKRLPDGPR